jgi:hypothetical protein
MHTSNTFYGDSWSLFVSQAITVLLTTCTGFRLYVSKEASIRAQSISIYRYIWLSWTISMTLSSGKMEHEVWFQIVLDYIVDYGYEDRQCSYLLTHAVPAMMNPNPLLNGTVWYWVESKACVYGHGVIGCIQEAYSSAWLLVRSSNEFLYVVANWRYAGLRKGRSFREL